MIDDKAPAKPGTPNYFPVFFCLAALAANHALFRLGALPAGWTVAAVVTLAAIALLAPHLALGAAGANRPAPLNGAIGAACIAPVLLSFALGLGREFPFSGDQSFHIKQAYYLGFWWLSPPGSEAVPILGRALDEEAARALLTQPWRLLASRAALLVLIVASAYFGYRRNRLAAAAFAAVALVAWGLFEHTVYLRYPGAGYLLTFPFLGAGYLSGNFELPGRLANVLAAPLWLFVLRPWLVGRWPDWKVLPVAALLLWHKDVVYYFDSTYLEPWSVVFALLAIEVLIARGASAAPVACLLIGLAATVKEPAIFALPFVWLAGTPWRLDLRRLATLCGAALAAGFPFVLYYAARNSLAAAEIASGRDVSFGFSGADLAQYLSGVGRQLEFIFNGTSALAAIVAVAASLILLYRRDCRWTLLCLVGAGLAIVVLFMLDRGSRYWSGYFRFFVAAWPFLAAGLLATAYALGDRAAAALGVALLLLQAPSAYTAVARSAGPASARNFAEHYDAPLVFPLKSLRAEAARRYGLPPNAPLWSSRPDDAVKSLPGVNIEFAPLGEPVCACSAEHPNVMALFVRYANLNARFAETPPAAGDPFAPPLPNDRLWRRARAERPLCMQKIKETCRQVIERTEGGETVAVLGLR